MKRSQFIKGSLITVGGAFLSNYATSTSLQEKEIFNAEEISEFVIEAHRDYEKTKRVLEKKPLIINCANQFSKGDFETALGAASHMGRKDIADLLISRGARLDLFTLAFLGHTRFLKKMIKLNPQYLSAAGPHGFTLLHHADVGKHKKLANWLKKKGLAETRFENVF